MVQLESSKYKINFYKIMRTEFSKRYRASYIKLDYLQALTPKYEQNTQKNLVFSALLLLRIHYFQISNSENHNLML